MSKKISKVVKKMVEEVVEIEVGEVTLEEGTKKYVRSSNGGHWVIRTEKEEAFCCMRVKIDDFLSSSRRSHVKAQAEGDTKIRYWMIITTSKVVMEDSQPYSKYPSWGVDEKGAMESLASIIDDLEELGGEEDDE